MNNETLYELLKLFFEKGILACALLLTGYIVTKSIEKIKSNDAFNNEITKKRIEKISKFYDLFSEYEHWTNRLIAHSHSIFEKKQNYLTIDEFNEAKTKSEAIENIIGFELNQIRFWINDNIYFHTVTQLEIFKEMKVELLINGNFSKIKDYRHKLDTIRMNIDKLIPYLKTKQDLKLVKYNRSSLYN
jgi:hypothetical protein